MEMKVMLNSVRISCSYFWSLNYIESSKYNRNGRSKNRTRSVVCVIAADILPVIKTWQFRNFAQNVAHILPLICTWDVPCFILDVYCSNVTTYKARNFVDDVKSNFLKHVRFNYVYLRCCQLTGDRVVWARVSVHERLSTFSSVAHWYFPSK